MAHFSVENQEIRYQNISCRKWLYSRDFSGLYQNWAKLSRKWTNLILLRASKLENLPSQNFFKIAKSVNITFFPFPAKKFKCLDLCHFSCSIQKINVTYICSRSCIGIVLVLNWRAYYPKEMVAILLLLPTYHVWKENCVVLLITFVIWPLFYGNFESRWNDRTY